MRTEISHHHHHHQERTTKDSLSTNKTIIRQNQDRCQQILECKQQIEYWTSKLEFLESERAMHIKLTRLRLDASSTWSCLSKTERLEKKFILAALESEELPPALDDFQNSGFPPSIRMDKDILLARVSRDDFAKKYENERLFVPPKLRGDKEVVLRIIPKHCAVVECMACHLRDDTDIFQAVLSNETLPSHVLQHFSERIRSDARLMRQLIAHKDGSSSMAFVSASLRNDKQFMLQAIQMAHHRNQGDTKSSSSSSSAATRNNKEGVIQHDILRYASQRLRDDPEVVLAAVKQCGLNLKHASYTLRRDLDIVLAATEQNATAFRYCLPSAVKDDLLCDRDFVMNKLLRNSATPEVLPKFIEHFKSDREIVLKALEWSMDWSIVPLDMQHDPKFAAEAVQRNPSVYMELSEALRGDERIARCVLHADGVTDNFILEATDQCPNLLSDHEIMLTIVRKWRSDVLHETLRFSPMEIRGDKDIMLEAVKNNPSAYDLCSDELATDHDIVLATVEGSPSSLYFLNDSFQVDNPDIVARAIECSCRDDLWATYDDVCDELWADRTVALAWLSKGGDWLDDDFPEEFENDENLLLAVARENWSEFENASENLRSNKEFMMQAISMDARVINYAADKLRFDEDLALLAFSKDQRALEDYSNGEEFEFVVSLTEKVRKSIEQYETFFKLIVSNIELDCERNPRCSLHILNQGTETVHFYSNIISEYVGLPEEHEYIKLKDASANLLKWGF